MERQKLNQVLQLLDEAAIESSNGEITIDGLIPVENKIKHLKTVLKEMNARILYLKSVNGENKITELPEEDLSTTFDELTEEITSQYIINSNGVNLGLETYALEGILNNKDTPESKEKVLQLCNTLFNCNDNALTIQSEIHELQKKLLQLKIKDLQEVQKYRIFLKEQEELRVNKLEQSNPTEARFKQKIEQSIQKINLMKKLIMKLISGSTNLLNSDETDMLELLKKHRKIINIETISNMLQDQDKSSD